MATIQPLTFGVLLKRSRRAAGLTQEALAARANYSPTYISMLERGERTPQLATVELLAEALELGPAERTTLRATVQAQAHAPSGGLPSADARVSGGPGAPLVGRGHELAAIERFLAGRVPPVLLLAGEPGIGKTRLLREATRRARQGGWCVLEDGCHQSGGQEPYAPLLGALEKRIHGRPFAGLRADLEGCSWLVRLLPELAETILVPVPQWTLPPRQERRLMFAAVGRFLANVAGPSGTLLVLDDLQWAGPDALDLLATLARAAPEAPLAILGAYRSTEVHARHPLGILQDALVHEGLLTLLALAALAAQDAAALLGNLLGVLEGEAAVAAARILERAGGVPFFLVSLAQGLRVEAGDGGDGGADAGVPADAAASIRQRVAALSPAAQELLKLAAVAGRVVAGELLVAVAPYPEEELIASLEALCRAGLLCEGREGTYTFAHDLIREVVEGDLSAMRRRALHRRIAESLERGRGERPIERLAYHYARSGRAERALPYIQQVADRAAAQYAFAEAEAAYRDVIELARTLRDAAHEGEALEKLGVLLDVAGRLSPALDALERAIATYRSAGEMEGMQRAMARLARVHRARGTPHQGLALLQPLLPVLEGSPPSQALALLHIGRAHLHIAAGQYHELLATAERAADIARAIQAAPVLAEAEYFRGAALALVGRADEGLAVLEAAIPLAEAARDSWILCFALNYLSDRYLERGDFARCRAAIERAVEVAERMGAPGPLTAALYARGKLASYSGDWRQARRDFERAAATVRPMGTFRLAPYPPLAQSKLCLLEGRREEAHTYRTDALARAASIETAALQAYVATTLAEWDLLEARPAETRARLEPLLGRPDVSAGEMTTVYLLLAEASLDLGDAVKAGAMLAAGLAQARDQSYRLALVDALRIQALLATRRGQWQEAAPALEEAVALARSMPYPYAEAKALYVHGRLHVARGEPVRARERLEAARAICARLGERLYAERVERALAGLRAP